MSANKTNYELADALVNKNAESLRTELLELLQKPAELYQIDCDSVSVLETACAQVLLSFKKSCEAKNLAIEFMNPSPMFILAANQLAIDDALFTN